jgi:hypothetical protein
MDSTGTVLLFSGPEPDVNCTLTLICNNGAVSVNLLV